MQNNWHSWNTLRRAKMAGQLKRAKVVNRPGKWLADQFRWPVDQVKRVKVAGHPLG